MAKRTIVVSDLSGTEIDEKDSATVRITFAGSEKGRELEITATEANELLPGGKEFTKRGRKGAKPAAAPAATK